MKTLRYIQINTSVSHIVQPQRSAVVHPKQLRQRLARLELAPRPMRHRPAPNEARNGRRTGTYIIDERTRARVILLTLGGHGPSRSRSPPFVDGLMANVGTDLTSVDGGAAAMLASSRSRSAGDSGGPVAWCLCLTSPET